MLSSPIKTLTLPLLWADQLSLVPVSVPAATMQQWSLPFSSYQAPLPCLLLASLQTAIALPLKKVMHSQQYFQRCAIALDSSLKAHSICPQTNLPNKQEKGLFWHYCIYALSFCAIFHLGTGMKFHSLTEDVQYHAKIAFKPACSISQGSTTEAWSPNEKSVTEKCKKNNSG